MRSIRAWFRQDWTTPVVLLGIFVIALYLRTYFPWNLAWPDGLLSGGSDSYYHRRIIETIIQTGKQLTFDPLLNFPMGLTNPRPPVYQWTTAVTGILLAPLFGDVWRSVTFTFLIGTAVWGALTVFPLYFLTKEAFGKRAALLAAFFLAVLPANLQRSPATDADHDAIVLFFVVTSFFFFLKSLRVLNERRWVENWAVWRKDGRTALGTGLRGFFSENRSTVLYAMLSGWSIAAIALIWQGWAYAPTILLVYFLFQLLVHRFRNQDAMGIVIAYAIGVGLPLLVSFPWYWANNQIKVWYDVPFYLFLLSLGLGIVFTVTRDYPWALIVPGVIGSGAVALALVAIFYPAIGVVFVSGAGYFVRSKAYETIAEAQPPGLSQVMMSFGIATYFLALFGVLWMAYTVTKRRTPDYLFVVVWVVAAIFMAQAAARFIFNASPAFAVSSAWITVLLLERVIRFDEMRKTFRSLGGSRLTAFRRSVKVRHVFGAGLVILILLPNVWFGVDASIPFEEKSVYDKQVYDAFPSFWKPPGYTSATSGGGTFFFGAFGYSLPLTKEYFPAAWSWFSRQDANVTPDSKKPAYLSWWDYGFEAVNAGRHPTVADNFLDGYPLAGQFITAQSENDAIALLDLRLLEGNFYANGRHFSGGVRNTLTSLGVPYAPLEEAFQSVTASPSKYVNVINADPVTYGDWETLQPLNAQYIYGRVLLTSKLDDNGLAELNHALREQTGASIRYFSVDTRLFPLDGQNTGIFYAPAKLSDHRIEQLRDGRTIPIDFFDITANVQGKGAVNIKNVLPTDTVTSLSIHYKDAFYNSMFYRAYAGFAPKVAGQTCDDCIPGIQSPTNQQIANIPPMQAWNLTHFRLAYKTAYYNPYPPQDVANHTDAWTAVEFTVAQDLQGKINRGEAVGVVDLSPAAAIRRGIVFVKYYDGAFLNGTVTLGGTPWPGVRVTASDEFGVPHDTAVTDSAGRYSVLLPFGDIRVQATLGRPDNRTLAGSAVVGDFTLHVSDAASMRENVDENGDGFPDWLLTRDIPVAGEVLDGTVFVDTNKDGKLQTGEAILPGATVSLQRTDLGLTRGATADGAGHVRVEGLYVGPYAATVSWEGRILRLANVTIAKNQAPEDLAVTPATLQGFVLDPNSQKIGGAALAVTDLTNGTINRAITASDGSFTFTVLPGDFSFVASRGSLQSLPDRASVVGSTTHNVTVYPSATIALRSTLGGAPTGFVTVEFTLRSVSRTERIVTTDAQGAATLSLPAGTWDVHARHYMGASLFAFVGGVTVAAGETINFAASLVPGAAVGGTVVNRDNATETVSSASVLFRSAAGEYRAVTDLQGRFLVHLPLGAWTVQVSSLDFTFLQTYTIPGDTTLTVPAAHGVRVDGAVFRSFPGNVSVQIEDPVPDAVVAFSDATRSFQALTAADGRFSVALPPDGQFALRIEHEGYVPYDAPAASPFQWQTVPRYAILARNVTVHGNLTLSSVAFTDPTLPIAFRAEGPGAISTPATLDGTGGYSVDLSPGRYQVVVDRDTSGNGAIRQQLLVPTHVSLLVGNRPPSLDLVLVTRMKIDGTVTLGGQPRSPVVSFEGPEVVRVNATNGAFTTFLATGAYTVRANFTQGLDTYLAFTPFDVQAPGSLSLALRLATNVTGTATYANAPISGIPVVFTRQGGGEIRATTDSDGLYSVLVIGGTYDVAVDRVTTASQAGATRTVRYTFSGSLDVVQDTRVPQVFNLELSRTLANTSVSGTIRYLGTGVPASLTFTARGTSGINATAVSGSDGTYALAVQPGTYDVYAFDALDQAAFLGSVTVAAAVPRAFDVTLVAAFQVSGVTSYRTNVRTAANMTFTSSAGAVALRSDPAGAYQVWLPGATYSVEASTVGSERAINVTYRTTSSLTLSATSVLNLPLAKVSHRVVDVTWDALQKTTVRAGGSATYTVVVTNAGNEDDTYALSGSAQGFSFAFSPDKVSLPFGAGSTASVSVTITAAADAQVDHGPITIVARSQADANTLKSVTLTLDVSPYQGLDGKVSSSAPVWDGRFLNYTLEIHNAGNLAATYRLTVPNLDELAAAGWRVVFVPPTGGAAASSIDVTVTANTTVRPTVRFQNLGGSAGTLAQVDVVDTSDSHFESRITINVQMPQIRVEGSVRAGGSGITSQAPGLDLATVAFLISFVAIIGAAVYLAILRRRSR